MKRNFLIAVIGLVGVFPPASARVGNICFVDRVEQHPEGLAIFFEINRRYFVHNVLTKGRIFEVDKGVVTEKTYDVVNGKLIELSGKPTEGPLYLSPGERAIFDISSHFACSITASNDSAGPGATVENVGGLPGGPRRRVSRFYSANQ